MEELSLDAIRMRRMRERRRAGVLYLTKVEVTEAHRSSLVFFGYLPPHRKRDDEMTRKAVEAALTDLVLRQKTEYPAAQPPRAGSKFYGEMKPQPAFDDGRGKLPVMLNVRVPREFPDRLKKAALSAGITTGEFIRRAIQSQFYEGQPLSNDMPPDPEDN